MDELNVKQRSALQEFRKNVSDVLHPKHDDHFLLRWLKARSYDPQKAEEMLRKNVAWRKTWKADTVLTEWRMPEVLERYMPGGQPGYDKDGYPVWIFPVAGMDLKGLSYSVKRDEIIRHHIWIMEKMTSVFEEQTVRLGRRIDKMVFITNMENYGLSQMFAPGSDIMMEIFAMVEANYPEIHKTNFVINASPVVPFLFNAAKPFLHEDTRRKMKILGKGWKAKLLEVIEADQLPEHYGGTLTDLSGDPRCPQLIAAGGEVPKALYRRGEDFVDADKIQRKTVARSSKIEIDVDVTEPGLVIKWVFWTKDYDIEFSLHFIDPYSKSLNNRKSGHSMQEILPLKRYNCHQVPEDGFHTCEKVGKYILRFDNTFSWIHSKSLSYVTEVARAENSLPSEVELVSQNGGLDVHDILYCTKL